MSRRKTQKIVFYDVPGDIDTKRIVLPKIINTDISFQLMFGLDQPHKIGERYKPFKEEVYLSDLKTR